ncbi:LysR family transcriptional regulator [Streptomyces sp. NPDC058683]|uniref:helix-turn-helix domain-containing protein n=1 Tax=Streptomyces sp. NPDC058683 TaxID=3346597 RepID=UPI00365A2A82
MRNGASGVGATELRRLSHFVAVAGELHFGRAADRPHIVQSAVSMRIQRLEREPGAAATRPGRPGGRRLSRGRLRAAARTVPRGPGGRLGRGGRTHRRQVAGPGHG